MRTVRLKNAPKGQPYGVETTKADLDADAAHAQAELWWESGGTIAVVVLDDEGKEDSRYIRDYVDDDRVPEGWERTKRKAVTSRDIVAAVLREEKRTPKEATNGPDLGEEPAERPQRVQASNACPACSGPLGVDHGERDKSPSGRLADGRCGSCGRPMSLPYKDLLHLHLAAEAKS